MSQRQQTTTSPPYKMSQRVTFDELYRRSSQYRLWSFTEEELLKKRIETNNKGAVKVDERLKETPDIDPSQIEKVTVDEELEMISFYSRRITQLAKHFNMPSQVRATAISFMRKFYLVNSVMEFHPKLVLLTCLFLAAKAENFFISINSFCKRIPKTTPESILSLEFELLQSLKFTILTHHPYRPLYGFFYDIQDTLKDTVAEKELGTVYDKARNLINEALISDAVFLFTPPQVALACFKEVNNDLVLKYLERRFKVDTKEEVKQNNEEEKTEDNEKPEDPKSIPCNKLIKVIEQCQEAIRTARNPSKEVAISIDRKVQYCLAPSILLKRKRDTGEATEDPNKRLRTESAEPKPETPA